MNPSPSSFRNCKFLFYVCEELSVWQIHSSGLLDTTYRQYHVSVFFCLTPMFTAVLFTTAKTWKQLKSPWTEEWIKKMWHIYTMEYYTAIKKYEPLPSAATWVDLEIIILSEVNLNWL